MCTNNVDVAKRVLCSWYFSGFYSFYC